MSRGFITFFIATMSSVFVVFALPTFEKRSLSGRGTWFNVGLGSCGQVNVDSDAIVALASSTYAGGVHCDKMIRISDNKNGKTTTAMVRDTCPSCAAGDLDLSPSLFQQFESLDAGVIDIVWDFV